MSPNTKFVDERVDGGSDSVNVHYLPVKIEFNGKANIQEQFVNTFHKDEETNELKTEFRGRPFCGTPLLIDETYKGIVVDNLSSSSSSSSSKGQDKEGSLYIKKGFSNLTYWNWDKTPSGMDTPVKLMDWLELANVLHEPESTGTD